MKKKFTRYIAATSCWPDWTILLVYFLYTLIIGLLIQLVLLPYVFPQWHAGEGLIKGLDSFRFHIIAVLQAQKIATQGWQVWVLAPFGQPVAGIASAVYALVTPKPWTLLPLNAMLHALAAWTFYKMLRFFLVKRRHALLASLPFLLFPSALSWVSQMHNDNYSVTGCILMAYGWVCFARQKSWQNWRTILVGSLAILAGGSLVWLVRPYTVNMYTAVGGVLIIFLIPVFLVRWIRSTWRWKRAIPAIGVICLVFAMTIALRGIKIPSTPMSNEELEQVQLWNQNQKLHQEIKPDFVRDASSEPELPPKRWQSSTWLPVWIDTQMKSLSETRYSAISIWETDANRERGSNIDTDVRFHNIVDIVRYLPRAAEISFLAPFPSDWFLQGSKGPNTMMRRVSGIEMVLIYLCWPGLLYAVWSWRKRPEIWAGLLFLTGMMIIYTLGTPNIGSLYRFRYAFIMPLAGLGLAGWLLFIQDFSDRKKKI